LRWPVRFSASLSADHNGSAALLALRRFASGPYSRNTMLQKHLRLAFPPAYLPSLFSRPLFHPTSLPSASHPPHQIIAAPTPRWWEWQRWWADWLAARTPQATGCGWGPMRQSANRHPVGSFLAICTDARVHRAYRTKQPLLRVEFLSHAGWMRWGSGRISVHFVGPFTANHEVWGFLENWLGRRLTAAQWRRGVDCASLVHRGAVLKVGRVFYPTGGVAARISQIEPCSASMAFYARYRLIHG